MKAREGRASGPLVRPAVALLSGVIFILAHFKALTTPYVVNDDVRQQIFWMQQWLDPELFKGDLLADYARHYVPWGVKGLYWLASWVADPTTFSKVLPGLLFIFLALCLYRIGLKLGGRRLAWTTVAVYWLMPFFLDNLAGGLARAFAAPLLAFFWLSWQEDGPGGWGPPSSCKPCLFPISSWSAPRPPGWPGWRAAPPNGPPPFPARPPTFSSWRRGRHGGAHELQLHADGFGPLVSYAGMVNRPEFYAGGRYAILPVPSIFWELISPWEWIAPFRDLGPVAGIAVCVVLLPCGAGPGPGLAAPETNAPTRLLSGPGRPGSSTSWPGSFCSSSSSRTAISSIPSIWPIVSSWPWGCTPPSE